MRKQFMYQPPLNPLLRFFSQWRGEEKDFFAIINSKFDLKNVAKREKKCKKIIKIGVMYI